MDRTHCRLSTTQNQHISPCELCPLLVLGRMQYLTPCKFDSRDGRDIRFDVQASTDCDMGAVQDSFFIAIMSVDISDPVLPFLVYRFGQRFDLGNSTPEFDTRL